MIVRTHPETEIEEETGGFCFSPFFSFLPSTFCFYLFIYICFFERDAERTDRGWDREVKSGNGDMGNPTVDLMGM